MFEECYAAMLHYEKCNPIDLQNVLFYKLLTIYLWAPSNAADRFSVSISWGQISCSNFVSLRNCLMYRNGFRVLYLQRFARKNIEWKIIHLMSIIVDYEMIIISLMLSTYSISILVSIIKWQFWDLLSVICCKMVIVKLLLLCKIVFYCNYHHNQMIWN